MQPIFRGALKSIFYLAIAAAIQPAAADPVTDISTAGAATSQPDTTSHGQQPSMNPGVTVTAPDSIIIIPPKGPSALSAATIELDALKLQRSLQLRVDVQSQALEAFRESHDVPGPTVGTARMVAVLSRLDTDDEKAHSQIVAAHQRAVDLKSAMDSGTLLVLPEIAAQIDKDPQLVSMDAEIAAFQSQREILAASLHDAQSPDLKALDSRIAECRRQADALRSATADRDCRNMIDEANNAAITAQAEETAISGRRNDLLLQVRDLDHWLVDDAALAEGVARGQKRLFDLNDKILRTEFAFDNTPLPKETSKAELASRLDALRFVRSRLRQRVDIAVQDSENFREAHNIPGIIECARITDALVNLDEICITTDIRHDQATFRFESLKKQFTAQPPQFPPEAVSAAWRDPQLLAAEASQRTLERDRAALLANHDKSDPAVQALDKQIASGQTELDSLLAAATKRYAEQLVAQAQQGLDSAAALSTDAHARRNDLLLQAKDQDRWLSEYTRRQATLQQERQLLSEIDDRILTLEMDRENQ